MTLEDRLHSFQIKYSENGQEYTLYIQVPIFLRISNRKVSKMTTTSPYRPRVMGNETSGYNWQGTLSVTTQVSKTGSTREFLQVWYKTCFFVENKQPSNSQANGSVVEKHKRALQAANAYRGLLVQPSLNQRHLFLSLIP